MWYNNETFDTVDYSYLDLLFDNQVEANEFLVIFIKELELAKTSFRSALVRRNTHLFRQTYHNVSPHLEILKINKLHLLLQQARTKILDTRQPFEDKELYISSINAAFENVIKEIKTKILENS